MSERRASLEAICQKYGVAILYSFGSRAKEAVRWLEDEAYVFQPGPSDLDIGVKALPGVRWSLEEQIRLTIELEDLFDVDRVDLVVLGCASPYLEAEVIHGERLYAQDEYKADLYDLYMLRREEDLLFLEDERARMILRMDKEHDEDPSIAPRSH